MNPALRQLLLSRPALSLDRVGPTNPLYVAHRGACLMFPENTTQAFDGAWNQGLRALEMDVQALSDGVLAVMHDSTVDRTTTGTGNVSSFDTAGWLGLTIDAGTWFGGGFGDLTPPLFADIARAYKGRAILMPEAKVTAVKQTLVDALVAEGIPRHQCLFQAGSSDLAPAVAAGYPACYVGSTTSTEISTVKAAGATWVALSDTATDTVIQDWVAAGFKVLMFTVNRRYRRDQLLALGVSGFYTDDPIYLAASGPLRTTDSYAAGMWMPGMLAEVDDTTKTDEANRGRFSGSDYWGWSAADAGNFDGVLQGWACPIKGNPAADTFTIDFKVKFNAVNAGDQTRFGSIFLADASMGDRRFQNSGGTTENGYHVLCRKNGGGALFTVTAGVAAQIGTPFTSTAIADGGEASYRLTVTPTAVKLERLDVAASTSSNNTAFRGGYFHLGRAGAGVEFRDVTIA